jgi:hypothetical protein
MFVTSHDYRGNLGGLIGADAKCQQAATRSHLPPGIYRRGYPMPSRARRAGWRTGTVRSSFPTAPSSQTTGNDLTDGILKTAPIIDESGHDVTRAFGSLEVWTNATVTGGIGAAECGRWSTTALGRKAPWVTTARS